MLVPLSVVMMTIRSSHRSHTHICNYALFCFVYRLAFTCSLFIRSFNAFITFVFVLFKVLIAVWHRDFHLRCFTEYLFLLYVAKLKSKISPYSRGPLFFFGHQFSVVLLVSLHFHLVCGLHIGKSCDHALHTLQWLDRDCVQSVKYLCSWCIGDQTFSCTHF